jgi:hypothetical protein
MRTIERLLVFVVVIRLTRLLCAGCPIFATWPQLKFTLHTNIMKNIDEHTNRSDSKSPLSALAFIALFPEFHQYIFATKLRGKTVVL